MLNDTEENAVNSLLNLPTEEVEVNDKGGKQSKLGVRADLLPPLSVIAVAKVLHEGATKYGDNTGSNWRLIPTESHLNHALVHIFKHFAEDTSEEHLQHAACRILMALEVTLEGSHDK